MSDLKIQGVVEMSSEGAERAFDRIGQKADSMAAKVTQTSGQAGQAVDQIGAGADRSATEFTRAEGRIVSSIKRATPELQNLNATMNFDAPTLCCDGIWSVLTMQHFFTHLWPGLR